VVKLFSSERRVTAAVVLVVLLLFLLRPGASRLKSRIVYAMSSALGRNVDVGSVQLRLLPRPGFDLQNLVVYDDPAFGAEPMLRAGEVTADLRLISLLRGRLEVARLDLSEPSLNLVHGTNGRWNLEALLERTARTPLAPTAKAKTEPRPAFPYIEASSARINFKNGPEKKPYALTDADFSLWQQSENTWGVRVKAQPIRSDTNLSDMGLLRIEGTWRRAAILRETPLQFRLEWDGAQLGQLTKFFTGNDQGWRGGLQLNATLTGTPAKLEIHSDATLQDFRRYDITGERSLPLAAHCEGEYRSLDHGFHAVDCSARVEDGRLELAGDIGFPGSSDYKLEMRAEKVPAQRMIDLARLMKKNLPDDLAASGILQGTAMIQRDAAAMRAAGKGSLAEFTLSSAANQAEIGPQTIPIVLTAARAAKAGKNAIANLPDGPHIEFGPIAVSAKGAGPTARGWINRSGYGITLTGEAPIGSTLRIAHVLGVPALAATPEGTGLLNLAVAGSWGGWGNRVAPGFSGPQITGTAKLQNVRVALHGAGGVMEISSADLQLDPASARVGKLSAKAAGATWTGSIEVPRGCGAMSGCEMQFDLHAARVDLSELSHWAYSQPQERSWYRWLEAEAPAGPSLLERLHAAGRISADHVQEHTLAASRVSASVSLNQGKMDVRDLEAQLLGGDLRGAWQADFSAKPATCGGSGTVSGVAFAQLADAMKDSWITGSGNASYELKGPCGADFWASAEGTLAFDVRNGSLPHVALAEDEPSLKFARLAGEARLHSERIEIKDAALATPAGKFQVDGTATWKRALDLKLTHAPGGAGPRYAISGTLAAPRVVLLSGAEQARLKAEAAK
jgi:hypothetical protein